jgi:hypothetical protein
MPDERFAEHLTHPVGRGNEPAGAHSGVAGGAACGDVVHLRVAPAARRRRTPAGDAWQLPAFDRYDDEVDPGSLADAVVLADHPEKPALLLAGRLG